jgi:hypothetical protein
MKRSVLVIACVFLTVSTVSSIEIAANFKIANLGFGSAATVPSKFDSKAFDWGFNVYLKETMAEGFSIETGFDFDPILRNLAYSQIQYKTNVAVLGVGPFFGVFNSTASPLKSGLSTLIRLEVPGAAFFSVRSDSSLGGGIINIGDYLQERNEIAVGFYVLNAICSLNMNTKQYQQKTDSGNLASGFTEYSFKIDLFKKNVPYTLMLNFAYQEQTKGDGKKKAVLDSLVLGTNISAEISRAARIVLNVESNIYSFGRQDFPSTVPNDSYLFRITAGTIINLGTLKADSSTASE